MAARTEHERAWYEQQAQRLNKRVQPLMLRWTQAYKVMPCKCMPLPLLLLLPLQSCHCTRGRTRHAAVQTKRHRGSDMASQPKAHHS